ncbi:MAG: hypothetical protein AAB411_02250 [Patescibacteria group bacterium]
MAKKSGKQENFIFWEAPEYEYHPKGVSWHWMSLVVAGALIIFFVWMENFLFVFFIVVAWILINNLAGKFPPVWEFRIDEKGIAVGKEKFYPYADMEGFDIHKKDEEYCELVLKMKTKLRPYLKINALTADEKKIEKFLSRFLVREEYHQSLTDVFSKLIRF